MGTNGNDQATGGTFLQHIVKPNELTEFLDEPSNARVAKVLRQKYFSELRDIVTPQEIMEVCDSASISFKAYEALYRVITAGHRNKGLSRLLPTPYSVKLAKKCANNDVAGLLGGFQCVHDVMPLDNSKSFCYNEFNNVYIDLLKLQESMIRFYGLTQEECDSRVIFILKLDECQVVKGQRLERVSITLMNRALVGVDVELNVNEKGNTCFGVQSEKNIWWLAAFHLPHETHESLRWYFNHTSIVDVVRQQQEGQRLHISGLGTFQVEWHLAGDLKTLKCMLGCKQGAMTLFPCIYCCHSKVSTTTEGKGAKASKLKGGKGKGGKGVANSLKNVSAMQTVSKEKHQWSQGILSCDQRVPPNRDTKDSNWDPILHIPLTNVHVCTLHARLRILDKLLMLHINYAWNMEPADRREECIRELEDILSSVGLHGGAVELTKDRKASGATQDRPNKICMGGRKARHLLSNYSDSQSPNEFQLWKRVCDITTYKGNEAALGLKRARVWQSADELFGLLEKGRLTSQEISNLKFAINTFTAQMVDAWGQTHITHYMVGKTLSLYNDFACGLGL